MIKKFVTILSISLLCFSSMRFETYAQEKYNRNLIKGNIRQISMELNESAFKNADEAIIINENSIIDGIVVTPLAYAKNAPIIPIKSNNIDKNTEDYLSKLKIKKITIIGSLDSISQHVEYRLEELGYEINRIYGKDRYDTSIKIALEMEKIKKVNNIILMHSSVGPEDSLSLYSFAAKNNTPIIWSDGQNFEDIKLYINKNNIKNIYAISNSENFEYKLENNIENAELIENVNKAQGNIKIVESVQKNINDEVYAINIEYGNYSNVNEYISLGVVAAKQNIPIFICEGSLTKPQEDYLEKNNIDNLIQVGSKINNYSIYNTLISKSFLYSMILIIILIIMLIRIFIYKV